MFSTKHSDMLAVINYPNVISHSPPNLDEDFHSSVGGARAVRWDIEMETMIVHCQQKIQDIIKKLMQKR
jgi:hypothetical protein